MQQENNKQLPKLHDYGFVLVSLNVLASNTCTLVSTTLKHSEGSDIMAHTNAHVHTTIHRAHVNLNTHVYSLTQHHTHYCVHAGWILSSLLCKPGGS